MSSPDPGSSMTDTGSSTRVSNLLPFNITLPTRATTAQLNTGLTKDEIASAIAIPVGIIILLAVTGGLIHRRNKKNKKRLHGKMHRIRKRRKEQAISLNQSTHRTSSRDRYKTRLKEIESETSSQISLMKAYSIQPSSMVDSEIYLGVGSIQKIIAARRSLKHYNQTGLESQDLNKSKKSITILSSTPSSENVGDKTGSQFSQVHPIQKPVIVTQYYGATAQKFIEQALMQRRNTAEQLREAQGAGSTRRWSADPSKASGATKGNHTKLLKQSEQTTKSSKPAAKAPVPRNVIPVPASKWAVKANPPIRKTSIGATKK